MSKSLSYRLHSWAMRPAGALRWVATIAFAIVIAASGIRVVYAHQHGQADEFVSTAEGTVALAVHLQHDPHDETGPNHTLHYHDSDALTHSPAAIGTITCNVPRVAERTLFADPPGAVPPALPEFFLRPPAP